MTGERQRGSEAHRPLRVGVVVDTFDQPQWAVSVLQDIRSCPHARLVVTIRNVAPPPSRLFTQRIVRKWRSLLYNWYVARDNARYGKEESPLAVSDATGILTAVPVIDVLPRMTIHTDRFEEEDIQRLRSFDLDVILRFGFRLLRGEVLRCARFGVWSYHHGDNQQYRGGPPCFWEVAEGNPVSGSILQVLTEELDAGRVLYRSYGCTELLSLCKTREECYGTAQQFVRRKLKDVYERGRAGLETHTNVREPWLPYSNRLYLTPTNREMLGFFRVMLWRRLGQKWKALFQPVRWVLAYHFAADVAPTEAGDRASHPSRVIHRFTPIIPPRGRMWADPFPAMVDGRFYVFFEDWPAGGGNGHIAVMEWNDERGWGQPVVALRRPYHLSYPFLLDWNGEKYLVPESVANRTVEAYRAKSFPLDWELDRVLLNDVQAVDPTIIGRNGRWWMFVSMVAPGGSSSTELHLYHAETPLGPWVPHDLNPVKSDVRSARPAGRPFEVDGVLYRPAQDCSVRYGYALVINRVEELSETQYREVSVARINPRWCPGLVGTHTLNSDTSLTVVDGLVRGRQFERWARSKVMRKPRGPSGIGRGVA